MLLDSFETTEGKRHRSSTWLYSINEDISNEIYVLITESRIHGGFSRSRSEREIQKVVLVGYEGTKYPIK